VLLIDADQQASATSMMLTHHPGDASVLDAVADPTRTRDNIIPTDWSLLPEIETSTGTLDLIPGHENFTDNTLQPTPHDTARLFALRRIIETQHGNYDLVVIDCPPSKGPIVQAALLAADTVVAVTTPEFLDVRGLAETMRFVDAFANQAAAANETSAALEYLIVNKLDIQQTDHRAGLAEISSQVTHIPWRQVPRRAVIPRVTAQGMPLVASDDRAAAPEAETIRAITADILETTRVDALHAAGERLRAYQNIRKRTSLSQKRRTA
jgi:ATPases involved in chromosome partitioning